MNIVDEKDYDEDKHDGCVDNGCVFINAKDNSHVALDAGELRELLLLLEQQNNLDEINEFKNFLSDIRDELFDIINKLIK